MLKEKKVYTLTFLGIEGVQETSEAIITDVSDTEQTIEVSAGPGARPYHIVGKRTADNSVFSGKHYGPKEDPKVFARWVVDEGCIMGIWVEDETMYSFSGFKDSDLIGFNG